MIIFKNSNEQIQTLRQQAYATKFGNEKLNSEVMREEAAAKIVRFLF